MDYKILLTSFTGGTDVTGWPRQRVIHACLRAAIMDGSLPAGARLLASRELADELGIARNTVLYAYDQLATEGLVQPGARGTLVAPLGIKPAAPPPAGGAPVRLARRVQSLRALPVSSDDIGAFAPGVPALDAFPMAAWRRTVERSWRAMTAADLNYADTAGVPALRQEIAAYLTASRGVRCTPEQVFITGGTQSSLELCARTFADAGETAWLENPGYLGAVAAFRAAQLRTVGIGVDQHGIAPVEADWERERPRLIYITPSHQYPTGTVLDLPRRLAMLARAQAVGALIIEDDYDSEFRYDGPPLPAMQGLAPDAPVIYLGTFSKTMFPALRTGFMVVPAGLVNPLRAVLARMAPHGRAADQLALADFLRSGQFGLHLRRMRRLYRGRRDALLAALQPILGPAISLHGASAGIHLSLRFHDAALVDSRIAAAALERGVVARALSRHAIGLSPQGWNGLLLGYSQVEAARMAAPVAVLAELLGEAQARASG
ncbi:MAG: PLP-dependent aminotransferase family protein [Massilia sp.]